MRALEVNVKKEKASSGCKKMYSLSYGLSGCAGQWKHSHSAYECCADEVDLISSEFYFQLNCKLMAELIKI